MAVTLEQIKELLEQAIRETVSSLPRSPDRQRRPRAYRPRLRDDGLSSRGGGNRRGGQWDNNSGALAEDEEAIYWQNRYVIKSSLSHLYTLSS
jgi:hypothetical protein